MLSACATAFKQPLKCKRFRFVANALASKHIAPRDNFFSSFERLKNNIKFYMLLLNMLVDAKDFVTFNCPKITEL